MDGKIHPKLQSETVLPRMVYLPCLTICHQRFSTYYDIFYILIYYVSSGTTVPPLCSLVWRKKCRKRGPFSGQPTSCTFPKTFQDSDVSAKKRYLLRSSWGSFPIQQDRGFGLDIKVLDVLQKPRLKTHYLTFNLLQSTGFRSQNIFHSIFKENTWLHHDVPYLSKAPNLASLHEAGPRLATILVLPLQALPVTGVTFYSYGILNNMKHWLNPEQNASRIFYIIFLYRLCSESNHIK